MTYAAWKEWISELPWATRWFALLVLVRPVVDALYFLKEVSPFLSPLYVVGALTPVLVVLSLFSRAVEPVRATAADGLFGLWGWLLFLSAVVVVVVDGLSVDALEPAFHLVTPVFLFVMARRAVQSERDLAGFVTTFFFSLLVPYAITLFENFVTPLGTQASRGLVRYQGLWGDVGSYGMFFTTGLLAGCYFFLDETLDLPPSARLWRFGVALVVGGLGLVSIVHGASLIIFAGVLGLFFLYGLGGRRAGVVLFVGVVLLGAGVALFGDALFEQYDAIVRQERAVVEEHDKGFESAFHGRGGRWLWLLGIWDELSAPAKLLGISLGYAEPQWRSVVPFNYMVLKGSHNDYLRVLFATGFVGLVSYLLFLGAVLVKSLSLPRAQRFLVWGALANLGLLSVSLTPTLYPTLQYLCFLVFAYAVGRRRRAAPEARFVWVPYGRRPADSEPRRPVLLPPAPLPR